MIVKLYQMIVETSLLNMAIMLTGAPRKTSFTRGKKNSNKIL